VCRRRNGFSNVLCTTNLYTVDGGNHHQVQELLKSTRLVIFVVCDCHLSLLVEAPPTSLEYSSYLHCGVGGWHAGIELGRLSGSLIQSLGLDYKSLEAAISVAMASTEMAVGSLSVLHI